MRKLLSKEHLFVSSIGSFYGAGFFSKETKNDFTTMAVWSHEEGINNLLFLFLCLCVVVVVVIHVVVVLLVVHVLIVAVVFQGLVVNIKLGAVDSVLNINLPILIPSSVLLLTVRKSSLGVAVGQAPLYKDRT